MQSVNLDPSENNPEIYCIQNASRDGIQYKFSLGFFEL